MSRNGVDLGLTERQAQAVDLIAFDIRKAATRPSETRARNRYAVRIRRLRQEVERQDAGCIAVHSVTGTLNRRSRPRA
jgi:hypothetical protein